MDPTEQEEEDNDRYCCCSRKFPWRDPRKQNCCYLSWWGASESWSEAAASPWCTRPPSVAVALLLPARHQQTSLVGVQRSSYFFEDSRWQACLYLSSPQSFVTACPLWSFTCAFSKAVSWSASYPPPAQPPSSCQKTHPPRSMLNQQDPSERCLSRIMWIVAVETEERIALLLIIIKQPTPFHS
jgi:hypothetical protein